MNFVKEIRKNNLFKPITVEIQDIERYMENDEIIDS
jgi:hypothetical protein